MHAPEEFINRIDQSHEKSTGSIHNALPALSVSIAWDMAGSTLKALL